MNEIKNAIAVRLSNDSKGFKDITDFDFEDGEMFLNLKLENLQYKPNFELTHKRKDGFLLAIIIENGYKYKNEDKEKQIKVEIPNINGWKYMPTILCAVGSPEFKALAQDLYKREMYKCSKEFKTKTPCKMSNLCLDKFIGMERNGDKLNLVKAYEQLQPIIKIKNLTLSELVGNVMECAYGIVGYIQDNYDKPEQCKKYITKNISDFDNLGFKGLLYQILVLFCIVEAMQEKQIVIKEHSKELLKDKIKDFCYSPYVPHIGETLNPICELLSELEMGKEVQKELFGNEPQQDLKELLLQHNFNLSNESIEIFQKALENGFIEINGQRLKWRKTKAMLAYFLEQLKKDGENFQEKKYNLLFGESRLGKARSQLMNNKNGDGKPRGYENIDILFKQH